MNSKQQRNAARKLAQGIGRGEGGGGGGALFVKVDAVVMLATGVTATGGVLATSADAALTHGCLTTLVAGVLKS